LYCSDIRETASPEIFRAYLDSLYRRTARDVSAWLLFPSLSANPVVADRLTPLQPSTHKSGYHDYHQDTYAKTGNHARARLDLESRSTLARYLPGVAPNLRKRVDDIPRPLPWQSSRPIVWLPWVGSWVWTSHVFEFPGS
jgi:hypothetical protein